MSIDPRQVVLLAIAIAVPASAFLFDRSRVVLAWVGFTLSVQIFDTIVVTNLPAGRLVGILFFPSLIITVRRWIRLPPARAWLINFFYMALLGVIFGFAAPWPDGSGMRPLTLRSEGRTVVYLIRTLSDLSLIVFVFDQVTRGGGLETLRRWIARGALATSIAAVISVITRTDFYGLITGLRLYAGMDPRPRGLDYEPRGLGLACAYGVIVLLAKEKLGPREWLILIVIWAGSLLSASASALAALLAALVVILLVGTLRNRVVLVTSAIGGALLVLAVTTAVPRFGESARGELQWRIAGRGVVESNDPANTLEAIAMRMDVFDSAASLFLIRHPVYALTGTGPGLMALPASEHIPAGVYRDVFPFIDNPPMHGLLLEVANTGLIGATTWLFQVIVIVRAASRLRDRALPFSRRDALLTFLAGATLYALQVGPSPVWPVVLGVGWAISEMALPAPVAIRSQRQADTGDQRSDASLA